MQCLAIVLIATFCDGIVLPSTVSSGAFPLIPNIDDLIREIFLPPPNNTSNTGETINNYAQTTNTLTKCRGLCVSLDESCGTIFGEGMTDYSDSDAAYFDIRASGDRFNPKTCKLSSEKCCEISSLVELSSGPKTVSGPINSKSCGISRIYNTTSKIIIAGSAQNDDFPWLVAVLIKTLSSKFAYKCGGSLIHPSVILTVAHCVHKISPTRFRVRAGNRNAYDSRETQERSVRKIVIHGAFNSSRFSLHNDIALLVLEAPLHLTRNIESVCLPTAFSMFDRTRCVVSGWEKKLIGNGSQREVLKKIRLPVVPRKVCERTLRTTRLGRNFQLHHSFLCAGGEPGRDACTGDGGSPLVCSDPATRLSNTRLVQVGIVALGIGCGNHIPGVYVNVPEFRNWIDEQMQLNGFVNNFYI